MRDDVALTAIDLASAGRFQIGSTLVDPIAREATSNGLTERIQPQNLKVLIALAEKRESVVSRGELISRCWGGRVIGDDVIHRAISTLRQFAARAGDFKIETVPKAGYRLTETSRRRLWPWIAGALLLLGVGGLFALRSPELAPAPKPSAATMADQERDALRALDVHAVERLLAAGWDPNDSLDDDHNTALDYLLVDCEFDPDHDRHKMVLIARTLIEERARVDQRNIWGDTPYSIAKAKRYCGPDHPVTKMFRMYCSEGPVPLGDRCMATYELQRGKHFTKS